MPRSPFGRALLFSAPLIGILFGDKALKLAAAARFDNIAPLPEATLPLVALLMEYWPLVACLVIPAIGLPLSALLGRWAGGTGKFVAWLLVVPLGAATTAGLEFALRGGSKPFDRPAWRSAIDQLHDIPALWWREGLVAAVAVAVLRLHFASADRAPARVRSIAVGSVLFIACVIIGIDFGFFVLTDAQLTDADVAYAFSAPREAWLVAHGAITLNAFAPLIVSIGVLISLYALPGRPRPPEESVPSGRRVHVGWFLAGSACLAFLLPGLPADLSLESYVGTPLLQLTVGPVWGSIKRRFFAGTGSASARVPDLSQASIVGVETLRARPLNVVVVMLESVRADATTVYSPSLPTTPFLAELAQESLVVDDMYAVIPRTSAAWVAILSGRYPGTREVVRDYASQLPVPALKSSLPALLRAGGYASAFITPTSISYENDSDVVRALGFQKVVTVDDIPAPASGMVTPFGWEDRAALQPIGRWLDERTQHRGPFLLAVMTNVGHYPYGLPQAYPIRHYPSRTPEHASYLNCVHYIDGYLRELVDLLRVRNLLENTLLIVLGDHGEEFQEHGGIVHGFALYDEVLHIPMLMRFPQVDARRGHITGLRQQIDILPTVAEALGISLQGLPIAGRSLLSTSGHEALFFNTHLERSFLALRAGSYKYLYDLSRDSTKVFDLKRDPGEHTDLHADVSIGEISQAETDLLAWHRRVTQTYAVAP